jgi:3-oxoacyl-(acyl-carrier-protein) synthase
VNGETLFTNIPGTSKIDFLKSVYKSAGISYPKLYKMDSLCKLAFIASELLLRSNPLKEKYKEEDIAIVIANSASSLEVDTEHQSTITNMENYFPSPSVFVYTLPNILVGEIAIRNQIKGENTFFIFATFDALFTTSYINSLLNSGKAACCIGGWVDFYEDDYEAFLYTVEKDHETIKLNHNAENINQLFKS